MIQRVKRRRGHLKLKRPTILFGDSIRGLRPGIRSESDSADPHRFRRLMILQPCLEPSSNKRQERYGRVPPSEDPSPTRDKPQLCRDKPQLCRQHNPQLCRRHKPQLCQSRLDSLPAVPMNPVVPVPLRFVASRADESTTRRDDPDCFKPCG